MLFVFLLPLVVTPAFDGFRLPKQFFTVICVALLFLVRPFPERFNRNLLASPLSLLGIGVFLTSLVSVFQAVSPVESLSSLFFLTVLILFYFILIARDESFAHWEILVQALVFSAFLVSLLGIYQFWFGHIPELRSVAGPSATFGNKNLAAYFVSVVFPFSLYLFRRYQHLFYGLVAAVLGIYIFYCQTVGVFLAGLVSVAASVVLSVRKGRRNRKRTEPFQFQPVWKKTTAVKAFICLMVVIGLVILPLIARTSGIQSIDTPVRIGKAIQGNEAGVTHRLDLWRNTLDMIGDHMLMGVGVGNWRHQYPLYHRSTRNDRRYGIGIPPSGALNDWLQVFAETGIFGFISWLLLAVMGSVMAVRAFLRETDRDREGMILALFWGFLSLVVIAAIGSPFNHPVPALMFWFILAGIHRFYHTNRQRAVTVAGGSKWTVWIGLFVLKVCVLLFALLWFQVIRSDVIFYRGVTLWNKGKQNQGIELMSRGVAVYPWNFSHHSTMSRAYLRMNRPDEARESASIALGLHPNDINSLNNLGISLNMAGMPMEALSHLERGVSIKPDEPVLLFNLGVTLRNLGRYADAAVQFQKVLEIDPRYPGVRQFLEGIQEEKDIREPGAGGE